MTDATKGNIVWSIIASFVVAGILWSFWDDIAFDESICDGWCGEYRSLTQWDKETERRVVVKVKAKEISIQEWGTEGLMPTLVHKVARCWQSGGLRVETPNGDTFWIKWIGPGVASVRWTDLHEHHDFGEKQGVLTSKVPSR